MVTAPQNRECFEKNPLASFPELVNLSDTSMLSYVPPRGSDQLSDRGPLGRKRVAR